MKRPAAVAGLAFLLAVAAGREIFAADLADETPSSSVSWICPKEPFEAGIGKPRFYRHAFTTREGLARATGRWWIDDCGFVHMDGKRVSASAKMVETPVDMTAMLAKPGRHVLAVEGKNMAGSGGVCLSIPLEYADGKNDMVFTSESWLCATNAQDGWTAPAFDDSSWQSARRHGDIFAAPWCSLADMSLLAPPSEKAYHAAIRAARDARVDKALAAIARETKPVCRIVYENGKPYFDIGGRLFETAFYNCSEGWSDDNPKLRRQTALFRDAGMHVYGIGVHTPRVWRPDGSIDFADAVAKMRSVLSIDPEARFQFCIDTCVPPKWWCDSHPDELIGYATGTPSYGAERQYFNFVAPSMASATWLREMADYITRLVTYLESTPYAKRIYAYRPDYGVHHEWHYYGFAGFLPDVGKAMTSAFRQWLERRYKGDVEALRRAWNDGAVTFATAQVPAKDVRLRLSADDMRDPVKDCPAIDYERCHAEQVRDCLFAFNRAAKEACGGRALVGNYCGYFFGMPFPAEAFHLENDAILDSPLVDFQCSPYVYGSQSRAGGNVQYARCLLEGLRRRGKVALLEADNVTTVYKFPHGHGNFTSSREDDLAILARDFVQTLCWGCGYWYFDFGIGWYDDPSFGDFFKKIYAIRREIKDCRSVSDVLVVGDYESVMLTNAGSSKFNDERTTDLVNELGHAGAPFDSASIVDLASGKLKDYKVYVFCNLHLRTPEKDRLVAGLRARGKTVVLPEKPMKAKELRALFAANGVHVWNDDPGAAIYASAACVGIHCASGGEKTIRLPRRSRVEMLYPERRVIASDADRIVFTPSETGMSTTLFHIDTDFGAQSCVNE